MEGRARGHCDNETTDQQLTAKREAGKTTGYMTHGLLDTRQHLSIRLRIMIDNNHGNAYREEIVVVSKGRTTRDRI